MSKLLQIAGVAALVLWTAAGAAAWLLTKEQVQVTIAPGHAERAAAADPTAVLADRLAGLEEDVRALTKALQQNLNALDDGIETAAAGRAAAAQAALARLEARLAAGAVSQAEESGRWRSELMALRGEVQSLSAAVAAAARPAEVAAPAAVAALPDPPPPAPTAAIEERREEPAAALAQAPPAAPPARKKSFLAFELPSDTFAFAGHRRWQVVSGLSRVGFDAKSTLHDFTGATTKVMGSLAADLAQPAERVAGTIEVEAAGLDTGLADRNAAMREHLGTAEHAKIRFELTGFVAERVDAEQMRVTGTASGKMTIHGQTRDVSMPVRLAVDASRRLLVEGEAALRLTDYGVAVPSKMGLISMQDEVKIWIALRARPLAKDGE